MNAKIVGLICGIVVTPVTLGIAMLSSGGGHGDYFAARLLNPLPMICPASMFLLAYLMPGEFIFSCIMAMTPVMIVLACIQFPIYGWLVGAALRHERRKLGS